MIHRTIHWERGHWLSAGAAHGLWHWGEELLLGYTRARHDPKPDDNQRVREKGEKKLLLARSIDGGEHWEVDREAALSLERAHEGDVHPPVAPLRFDGPGFALAVKPQSDCFAISCDRGDTWEGSYPLPDRGLRVKGRTDYLVNGPRDCLFFLSARVAEVQCKLRDRAYCARTTDGGRTVTFEGWMTQDEPRSVMPSTVRASRGRLITALRRRWDADWREGTAKDRPPDFQSRRSCNWIDLYESVDEGRSWRFLSLATFTDTSGCCNGNPPAMVLLRDGRLCLAYGFRGKPYHIAARLSADEGHTWSDPIVLRDDAIHWDLGYCRMMQRSDGKLVTIYRIPTRERPEQHVAATIWEP